MTTLEFLGVLLIILVATALLVLLVENLSIGKKSTEGICSKCGHEHSMDYRTEDAAVFLRDTPSRENFYQPYNQVEYIKYKCESCKMSTDVKWTRYIDEEDEYLEHSKRLSQYEVVTTFTRMQGILIPHYEEKKEPPGDE